jgi:amidase
VRFEEQHALWARYYGLLTYVMTHVWGAPPPGRTTVTEPPTALDLMHIAQERDGFILAWERFFDECDVLLCPAAIVTAFPHCAPGTPVSVDGTTAKYGQINHHCFPFDITGHPAVVLPLAWDRDGLPIGVQVAGPRWRDERLLATAERLVEVAGPLRRPPGY